MTFLFFLCGCTLFLIIMVYKIGPLLQKTDLDTWFYFPIMLFIVVVPCFFLFSWQIVFFLVILLSYGHRIFLIFCPYIKKSKIYSFLSLKNDYFEQNRRYPLPFSGIVFFYIKVFLLLFIYMASMEITSNFFGYSFGNKSFFALVFCCCLYVCQTSVEIVNILYRPKLPASLLQQFPMIQKRYSPFLDVLVTKILPVCAKVGGVVTSAYVGSAMGYKAVVGPNEIDPVRNILLNKVHQFPSTHVWNEFTLSGWSSFKKVPEIAAMDHSQKVNTFLESEAQIDVFMRNLIKVQKTSILDEILKDKTT